MPADGPSHGLIAVLLITRPKSGPRLVFHYPASPKSRHDPRPSAAGNQDSDDDSDDDNDRNHAKDSHSRSSAVADAQAITASSGATNVTTDAKVLAYAVDTLEKLLSPGRWSDRKKFEIRLDDTTFVGHPVYANEDGLWSTKTSAAQPEEFPRPTDDVHIVDTTSDIPHFAVHTAGGSATSKPPPDFAHISESLDSHAGPSLATSFASNSTTPAAPVEQLTMFHVVFALRSNTQDDTAMIYEHIARKLSKALHYCQKRNNYLSIESRKLVALKTKAKQDGADAETVLSTLIESSELAWSLKEIYEKIAAGSVAGIRLNGTEMSLHIPSQRSVHDSHRGTTPITPLSEHSALLLLEDKSTLLRELSSPEASPLAHFIREHTPTKSLQKLSSRLNTPLPEILSMSKHLIKWCKAQPVAPLHSRNTYVVAPSAPTDKVTELIPLYARKFAALPTLPQMLKVLSGRPIQYGLLIPSKDHRAPYMGILAFLLRHGLVVQLRTFGWLRLPSIATENANKEGKTEAKKAKRRPVSGISLLSPQLRPVHEVRDEDKHDDDDTASTASHETAVTAIPSLPENGSTLAPTTTDVHSEQQQDETNGRLVLGPLDPSSEEEEALERIISDIEDEELRDHMPSLLKYFDGEHALEDIAVAEGLKRARVEEWLDHLLKRGLLQTFRALQD